MVRKGREKFAAQLVDAIRRLRESRETWPQAWSNPVLQEIFENAEKDLHERLYQVMDKESRTEEA